MSKRRQPSKQFHRRIKGNSEHAKTENPDKQQSMIRRFRDCDFWIWTEVFALCGFFIFLYQFYMELEDRKLQRIAQAWESVTRIAPGNSGKGHALEYLNRQGIPLVGIDLSAERNQGQAYLEQVDLSGADLREVDLSEAILIYANLSGADLTNANLSGAKLSGADLSGADLTNANLSGVVTLSTDLSGATLFFANISGANLTGNKLSDPRQLSAACGNEETKLPEGFTIRICHEK